MLKRAESKQMKMSFVTLEELMPQEHFLRDLDRLVDFDFIYDKVADLYSNTGRPAIDPVVMIKMMLIGYIYGIDSERKLEQEITVNIAYRWFLGIDFDERVPDHSTSSQLRRRKFDGTTITALFILSFAMVMIIVSVLPVPVGITTVAASEETDQ